MREFFQRVSWIRFAAPKRRLQERREELPAKGLQDTREMEQDFAKFDFKVEAENQDLKHVDYDR